MNHRDIISKPEVSFWIPIITAVVGVAMSWAALTAKIDSIYDKSVDLRADYEETRGKVEMALTKQEQTLLEIQVKLAEIQKDILYIREKLEF